MSQNDFKLYKEQTNSHPNSKTQNSWQLSDYTWMGGGGGYGGQENSFLKNCLERTKGARKESVQQRKSSILACKKFPA